MPASARYRYDLPEKVRQRIFHAFRQHQRPWMGGGQYDFQTLLSEVGELILAKHGSLFRSVYDAARVSEHPVINHFGMCSDEQAAEFVVLCFQTNTMGGDSESARILVNEMNQIFEEESVGYELTEPKMIATGESARLFPGSPPRPTYRTEYPKLIKKSERSVHEIAVQPALEVLRDPRFATANSELMDSFDKVRNGNYDSAITSCGAAFESVMKVICDIKGWAYAKEKDACAKLVGVCKDHGLFFPFYVPLFEGVGTVRNKIGDAHGSPSHTAGREHAEHMIAMTCAHIHFLVRQAGI